MPGKISRIACTLLTAASLPVLSAGAAFAQSGSSNSCPCLNAALIDQWFAALELSPTREKEMFLCVDEPGFLTFDYFDRTEEKRALYIDLTYATTRRDAQCTFEVSDSVEKFQDVQTEMRQRQINNCRAEVLASQIWRTLKCPSSKRVLDR